MHQLEGRAGCAGGPQLIAHEILHRLDVVIDALLDRLDRAGRAGPRIARQGGAALEHARWQSAGEQSQPRQRELFEPQRFDPDALADQRGFGEVLAQRRDHPRARAQSELKSP